MWSHESAVAVSIKHMVLTKCGSHPSTQHSNERLVKISSRMARTGKTEQSANHYLIAANGFIREQHNEPSNDIVVNEEEGEVNSNTVGSTRIRGVSTGITKLVNI